MDEWFHGWFESRPVGLVGLEDFAIQVHSLASRYLSRRVVPAWTPEHKLEIAVSAIRLLSQRPVDERRLARLCAADTELESLIEIEVDIDIPGLVRVPDVVFRRLRERCHQLADRAISEEPVAEQNTPMLSPSFRDHLQAESTLTRLKRLKAGKRTTCCELWDSTTNTFTDERDRMAEIIQEAAAGRQGRPRGQPFAGQQLLDDWQADFRGCRTSLPAHEVEAIILDGPSGKRPGPDGVPSIVLKRYVRHMALVFKEAWDELASGDAHDSVERVLGVKRWLVIPKVDGANTVNKLRDLELGNEVRKVLARMLFRVLDEVCAHEATGLCSAQQAFVRGREIVRNMTMLCREFCAAAEEASSWDDLALDCSKGYNCMDHGWIFRCLEAAGLPPPLVSIVKALVVNMPVLVLDGLEYGPLRLLAGLTQGCPASCMLYIIAVDAMLSALQRIPRLRGVSGFVDDWSMGCRGLSVVAEVSALISDFERASGQRINRDKSAAIPARALTDFEVSILYAAWGHELRIPTNERVLGVYIGMHARICDQYKDALQKFDSALAVFGGVRSSMSLALRIVVVNVFLYPLFSYPNRHFFMPVSVLKDVERKVLGFLTPVCWSKLGLFTSIGSLYGLKVRLADLRLTNVASLLSTHEAWSDIREGNAASLSRWRRRCSALQNPAVSWKIAFDFFFKSTGGTYQQSLATASARRSIVHPFRVLHKALVESELPRWSNYLKHRVAAKGWCGELLLRGLRRLPRSTPQAHRWFLLKMHLNAPLCAGRAVSAGVAVDDILCSFCRSAEDNVAHVSSCPAVMAAYDGVAGLAALPPLMDARPSLMLQGDQDGATVAAVVAVFAAVWDVRAMCRRGVACGGVPELTGLLWRSVQCPWLMRCCPTQGKRERRAARVREPDATPGVSIYRSDGASRGQGGVQESMAGWGAAFWSPTAEGRGIGPPHATAREFLGDATNNVAEYAGLRACMARAARVLDPVVLFEVDSMLLARQLAHVNPWACRSESILHAHLECVRLGRELTERNVVWNIRHIYREFNQVADTLSNQAIDERDSNGPSSHW